MRPEARGGVPHGRGEPVLARGQLREAVVAAVVARQQAVQSRDIARCGAVGYRLTQCPKRRGLAEMDVRHQQRLARRPVDGLFREQPEFDTGEDERVIGRHGVSRKRFLL